MPSIHENLIFLLSLLEASADEVIDLEHYESRCGTLHCSLGLAATHPFFNEQGLRLTGFPINRQPSISIYGMDKMFGTKAWERLFAPFNNGVWDYELVKRACPSSFDVYLQREEARARGYTDRRLAIDRVIRQLEEYPS
jgi:hypothetical protein